MTCERPVLSAIFSVGSHQRLGHCIGCLVLKAIWAIGWPQVLDVLKVHLHDWLVTFFVRGVRSTRGVLDSCGAVCSHGRLVTNDTIHWPHRVIRKCTWTFEPHMFFVREWLSWLSWSPSVLFRFAVDYLNSAADYRNDASISVHRCSDDSETNIRHDITKLSNYRKWNGSNPERK